MKEARLFLVVQPLPVIAFFPFALPSIVPMDLKF